MKKGYTQCPYKKDSKTAGCVEDSQFICEKDDYLACPIYFQKKYENQKKKCKDIMNFSRNAVSALRDKGEEIIAIADKYEEILDRCLEKYYEE